MALRVLLADESSTIKKVFQLALQDFAVDVRPVNIGVDILSVAKSFQPDIIFADVLLQKKNGYDVCAELKVDAAMTAVPVVLMWSGFMELDEDKFEAARANGRLEKPFDVGSLRKLVQELVPKTGSQRLSQFLSFPKMPELEEKPAAAAPPPVAVKPVEDDFQQIPIPKMKSGAERFRIEVGANEDLEMPVSLSMPNEPINMASVLGEPEDAEQFTVKPTKTKPAPMQAKATPAPVPPAAKAAPAPAPAVNAPAQAPLIPQMSEAEIEKIVRSQSKEIIEAVVWRVLPELAQQIIEREIQKLLKEKDAGIPR
jgi:two-component system, cell cycle response regulator